MHYLLILMLALFSFSHAAYALKEDQSAARILTYQGIGYNDSPASSVTLSQFETHIQELAQGDYNVIALPDMIRAYNNNAPLPSNAVIITFDGSEKSTLDIAAPLLQQHQFPFTVFISPERIKSKNPRYLNLKDVKRLSKMQLVTFGIHPEKYEDPSPQNIENIRKNLNNAVSFYREFFNTQPKYLAFPHGIYSQTHLKVIKNYDFEALFGQESGVSYNNKEYSPLPRFVMTENYAGQDRFNMIVNSLPLPAEDVTPSVSVIENNSPAIGFTASNELNLDKLSCYPSGQGKAAIEKLNNRIEIRLKKDIKQSRFRVNCTLPVKNLETDEVRWRWLGFLFERF